MIGQNVLTIVLFQVDAAYENKANTVINVEPVESLQTSPVEKSEVCGGNTESVLP